MKQMALPMWVGLTESGEGLHRIDRWRKRDLVLSDCQTWDISFLLSLDLLN